MDDPSLTEHICILPHRKTKFMFKPLPPTAGFWEKMSRKLYSLIILDMQGFCCKEFYTHPSLMRTELKRHVNSAFKYTVHPFSILSAFINRLFFILLIHKTVFIVYAEAKPPDIFLSCLIRDTIHIFIIVTRFFTGYVDMKSREVIIEPRKIIQRYLRTYFILDIYLAVEEYTYLLKMELWKIVSNVISIFVYMIRLKTVRHVLDETMNSFGISKHLAFILYNTLLLILILQVFTSLIFWVPTHIYHYKKHFPRTSWIVKKNLSLTEYSLNTYVASFLMVISYFLGASHDDYVTEPAEQLLLFIFTFSGRMCTLFIIAKVLIYFGHSDVSESEYENMLFQLYNYMRTMKVPKEVQDTIIERMKYTYQKKYFNEEEILNTLTSQLKSELFLHGARNLIGKCALLKAFDRYDLTKLFHYMKSHIYSPNEIIQDYEDVQPYVFFVCTGMVAGYTNDGIQFLLLGEGDIMGYLRMAPNEIMMYSSIYISMETTEIYYIHHKRLKWVMQGKLEEISKYFRKIRLERAKLQQNCKSYHTKANTVMTQLKKGELLEKPKLRHGHADL